MRALEKPQQHKQNIQKTMWHDIIKLRTENNKIETNKQNSTTNQ